MKVQLKVLFNYIGHEGRGRVSVGGGAVHLLNYETGNVVTQTIFVMDSRYVINQSLWYVNID